MIISDDKTIIVGDKINQHIKDVLDADGNFFYIERDGKNSETIATAITTILNSDNGDFQEQLVKLCMAYHKRHHIDNPQNMSLNDLAKCFLEHRSIDIVDGQPVLMQKDDKDELEFYHAPVLITSQIVPDKTIQSVKPPKPS